MNLNSKNFNLSINLWFVLLYKSLICFIGKYKNKLKLKYEERKKKVLESNIPTKISKVLPY